MSLPVVPSCGREVVQQPVRLHGLGVDILIPLLRCPRGVKAARPDRGAAEGIALVEAKLLCLGQFARAALSARPLVISWLRPGALTA
jgi:hypothetical protein